MPDATHMDLRERVAALEQVLIERIAERDEALAREAALAANVGRKTLERSPVRETVPGAFRRRRISGMLSRCRIIAAIASREPATFSR